MVFHQETFTGSRSPGDRGGGGGGGFNGLVDLSPSEQGGCFLNEAAAWLQAALYNAKEPAFEST